MAASTTPVETSGSIDLRPLRSGRGVTARWSTANAKLAANESAATAMDAATSNAADMIERLTLYMNRVRQASITKEIIEVVSGAAAAE